MYKKLAPKGEAMDHLDSAWKRGGVVTVIIPIFARGLCGFFKSTLV